MALPFVAPPQNLSSDDVYPAELAQRVVDRCNDSVTMIGVEHETSGSFVGHHDVSVVPIATCLLAPPSPVTENDGQTLKWARGFAETPSWLWTPDASGVPMFYINFSCPRGSRIVAARCTPSINRAIGSLAASSADGMVPRYVQDQTPWVGTFHLGDDTCVLYLTHVLIVVYGVKPP